MKIHLCDFYHYIVVLIICEVREDDDMYVIWIYVIYDSVVGYWFARSQEFIEEKTNGMGIWRNYKSSNETSEQLWDEKVYRKDSWADWMEIYAITRMILL